jgi:hypothetical protein
MTRCPQPTLETDAAFDAGADGSYGPPDKQRDGNSGYHCVDDVVVDKAFAKTLP